MPPAVVTGAPRRLDRLAARVCFLAAAGWWLAGVGIPTDPVSMFLWLWLATIAWRWGVPVRTHLEFARDWWPPLAVLLFYGYTRGLADHLGIVAHQKMPIAVGHWLGGGELAGQRLQQWLCGSTCTDEGAARWYDTVFTSVYATHFVCALVLAVVLWLRSRPVWARWMRRYLALNLGALAVYVAYPMVPPWMASENGEITPPILRLTGRGGTELGLRLAKLVLGPVGNPVAAMPSLHAATACLVALFLVGRLRSPFRWLLLAYPLAMGFTLVYFGEHYVVDVLAGYLFAVLVHAGFSWRERRSAGAHQGTGADDASARPAYVVGELAVLGDDDHHPAGRLGRDELADHVVGDHAARAEQHLHPAR
jgi:membrane-associated phospholipid phosphatase